MPTPPISDQERRRRRDTIEGALREGFAPQGVHGGRGSSMQEAARRLGMPDGTLNKFVHREAELAEKGLPNFLPNWSLYQPEVPLEERLLERRIEQELSAARKRERELLDRIIALEDLRATAFRLAASLEGGVKIYPSISHRHGGNRSAILHISDVHCGEHVDLYEMDGLNAYDADICRARMQRLFQKTASQLTEHWSGDPVEEIVVCLGGDMIDNNLREESRRGGALPVVESAKLIAELVAGGLLFLHQQVGVPIRVYTSPGNHGRLTPKPHAVEGNIDNWDVMISWSIEKIIGPQDWIQFFYTGSGEALFNVYGWKFLLQHGHEGAGGTGGLYGPVYKQVRGMYRAHQSYGRRGRGFHFVLQGHDHTTAKIPFGFANGSVVGYNPYAARKLKADPAPASQNLLIVEARHGVISWSELFLGVPEEGSLYVPPEPAQAED